MTPPASKPSWSQKFAYAIHGWRIAIRDERSFQVHAVAALMVVVAGFSCQLDAWRWCVLILCITGVMGAELLNTALERLAKAVGREQNPHIGAALDLASGAVLCGAVGAAVVGALVFLIH